MQGQEIGLVIQRMVKCSKVLTVGQVGQIQVVDCQIVEFVQLKLVPQIHQ